MRKTRLLPVAASSALAITLAACSDSTDEATTSESNSAQETTGESNQPTPVDPSPSPVDPEPSDTTVPADPTETAEPTEPSETSDPPQEWETEPTDFSVPTDPVEYADALVVSWGNGYTNTMEEFATPEVIEVLGEQGGPNWQRTASDGGAGSVFVTYTNQEDGRTLELRVINEVASQAGPQGVVEAKLSE
ncbi:superantigen-like protein SSL4 [Flaviflexus massiliensis]|uniref:hypothetical protein n=1 Tax=Flaviflexus massiliensis TaxID=1522309 RepID=UPI0006D53BA8|nr:hypothetical protein [Flaviflexus massiliensis]